MIKLAAASGLSPASATACESMVQWQVDGLGSAHFVDLNLGEPHSEQHFGSLQYSQHSIRSSEREL